MKKLPVIAGIVALVCLAVTAALWRRAFPIAALEFRVSRGEAQVQLARFVEALGHPLAGHRTAAAFGEDSEVKNFLELDHGVRKLETLTREGLAIWYWTVRWFRPEQHEEFSAWLDPQGRISGFSHTIEEERALPSLDKDAARALAEDFLRRHITHHPFPRLRFISDSSTQRTHRIDWDFQWERDELRLGDAPYRIYVGVQGDAIGSYGESMQVPEWWSRRFAERREVNELCVTIAGWASLPIFVGAFVLFVVYARRHELRWRDVAPRTWLLIFALTVLAGELNEIPSLLGGYETTEKWGSFVLKAAFSALRSMLLTAGGMWLLLLIADPIYREQLPQHPSFRRALGAAALDDPCTVRALGVGIVFAAVGLSYVTLFYLVSRHFGAWAPVEIDYAKALSGWLPWVEPLQAGLFAAFGEELLFRVIGVLLYVKLARWRTLALVVAGATWAFLHSGYAQMPGYIRGVELTIEGVLWGVLMLRFGIITTLTAHYLYNCWLGAYVVFQSAAWPDKLGAIAVSVWPLGLFGWGLWRVAKRRGDVAHFVEEIAENAALPAPSATPRAPVLAWNLAPVRLAPRWRWIIATTSLAAAILVNVLPVPQEAILSLGEVDFSRSQIGAKADEIMRARGFAPERFRRIVTLSSQSVPATYLLEHKSLDDVARLFQTEMTDLEWHVRYFRVMEREEFSLVLDKQGRLLRWNHTVPREADGATLERDAALALAKEHLRRDRGVDFSKEKLVSESTTPQERRRDHWFTFERLDWQWGEAKLRASIGVQGDEPVGFNRWIEVPEAWQLARAKTGWRKFAAGELSTWLNLVKALIAVVLFVLLVRKHLVPWRAGFLLALVPTAVSLAAHLNQAPWFFSGYSTTTPLANYLFLQWGGGAVALVMGYLGEVLRVSVALGFVAWAFGWRLRDVTVWPANAAERRKFWADTATLLLASITLFWLNSYAQNLAVGLWLPDRAAHFYYPAVNAASPWLLALTQAFDAAWNGTLRVATLAAVFALVWNRYPRATIAVLLLEPLLDAASADSLRSFLYTVLAGEVQWLLFAGLLLLLWRGNAVLIFLYYFVATLAASVFLFLARGGPAYRWEAAPLLGLTALAILAAVLAHRRRAGRSVPAACN